LNLGIALGGGGLRGAVHIGFLEVLLKNNIKPDIIAGTSAGALVAGMLASGISPYQMQGLILEQQKLISKIVAHRLNLIPSGLIKGNKLEFLIKGLTQSKKFNDLNPKIAIVSTDINNGMPVIFTSEKLAASSSQKNAVFITDSYVYEAIRASISIPGIFQPKKINNHTLVDGGLVSNVPADVLKFMNVKNIIAVNLSFAVIEEKKLDSIPEILLQSVDIMGERISKNIIKQYADIAIEPVTGKVFLWEIHKVASLIEIGRKIAVENIPQIKALIK
jgi:NTE family protein